MYPYIHIKKTTKIRAFQCTGFRPNRVGNKRDISPSKILMSPDVLRTLTLVRPQSGPCWPVLGAYKIGKNCINIRRIQGFTWDRLKAVGSGGAREIAKKGNSREKFEKYQKNVLFSNIIKSMHTACILMLKIIIKFRKSPKKFEK